MTGKKNALARSLQYRYGLILMQFFFLLAVLKIKFRASYMLVRHSVTEPHPNPDVVLLLLGVLGVHLLLLNCCQVC